jgi:hypothetical protein
MAHDARRRLGLQEAELVASLTSLGPTPLRMDLQRIAAIRRALALKRVRVVARAWPSLRQALGDDFERVALGVLATAPMAARFPAIADGLAIAEHCRCTGAINDPVRLALLDIRVNWTSSGSAFRRRRWPWVGVTTLRDSGRIAVAARLRRSHIWLLPHCAPD